MAAKKTLKNEKKILKLLHSKKVAHVTAKEFEKFRRELSRSVIER